MPRSFIARPTLSQLAMIDLLLGFGRVEEMTCPIAIQGTEQPHTFDGIAQSRHHRLRAFVSDQLGVVNLAGSVIQDHQQIQPSVILKPLMMTAIDMQQHARNRPAWSAFPVRFAIPALLDQTRTLQQVLHPTCS